MSIRSKILIDYFFISKIKFLFIIILIFLAIKSNAHTSQTQESKIPPLSEMKNPSFLDKILDFYITKHDFINPAPLPFKYKTIRQFMKRRQISQENKADIFIFPPEVILEEEEKYRKEILSNVIKKEVNIDEYKLNENADIYGFPESKIYQNHPIKLLKTGSNKIKNFSEFPGKIMFEPKSLDIIDKPICIPAMFFLNLKNFKNEKLILNNIRSDLYQVTIFFFKGKDGTVFNQKNLYPKFINHGETLILQIVFLPDTIGEIKGNLYFEFSENKIVVFPIKIKAVENIYKVEPLYFNNWLGSKLLTQKLNIYNPHNKVLIIKEVINSFSSINLNWPNGNPVSSNSTAIDITMLEIPSKTNQTLLHINFYKEVSGIEYGLLQIKTDKDNLIVPVLIRVEIVGLKAFPNFLNFGLIDLNLKVKRLIPLSIENVSKKNVVIKRIFTSFEENLIEFIPIYKSKQVVIKPEQSITEFAYFMLDPINYNHNLHEHFFYKKIQGHIVIQTNFTENPFVYLNYEYYLDKNTFSYSEKKFELYYSKNLDQISTFESNFKINSTLNFIIKNISTDSQFLKISFDKQKINNIEKNVKIQLKIQNQINFLNKKFYFLCVKNANYISLIPIKLYDKSLDFKYFNERMQEIQLKGINLMPQKEILNLGSISSIQLKKRLFNITNDNPEEILILDIEHSEINIYLEYITFYNKYGYEENISTINKLLKMPIDKNFSIPANSVVSFSFQLNTSTDLDVLSKFKFIFGQNIAFEFTIKMSILKGNLNITPSVIRFEPAFPGVYQQKMVSSKSTYNKPVKIESITTNDPRIQSIIKTNYLNSNNRTEMMSVIFDPSKVQVEDNYMKGEFYLNTTNNYINYKELYLWKEKQKLWEQLATQGKTEINTYVNIQSNIQSEKVNIKALLTKPSLVKNEIIDFGLVHNGESVKRDIEVFNPSDDPITIQIMLAPEEFSDIYNNTMFSKNRNFRYTPSNSIILMDCCFYNSTSDSFFYTNTTNIKSPWKTNKSKDKSKNAAVSEKLFNSIIIEEDITMNSIKNYTKNDIIKKVFLFANNNIRTLMISSDLLICSPTFLKKNEIITNNYIELMEIIFSKEFNKDIKIIQKMTDAVPPIRKKNNEKFSMNFIEKFGYYLKLFFKLETTLKFRRKLKLKNNQVIFLSQNITNKVYTIKPHEKLTIGPILFNPNNFSNYSATLFIKNNLTILYPIKIMGSGGSGLLEFYSIEDDLKTEKKIEKLHINIDANTSLNIFEKNNDVFIKTIKLMNSGNLPIKIHNISIENMGCEAYGILLSKCSEITLDPKQSMSLNFTIRPNFNFFLMERNIVFYTYYHRVNLKIYISISEEILASRNRLLNTNIGGFTLYLIALIILMILFLLSREYIDFNSIKGKNSLIFISPKEIIEKNPILKIENLLLKTYRRMNKKMYDDFNIKQYTTNPPNLNTETSKKSVTITRQDSKKELINVNEFSPKNERDEIDDNLSHDDKSQNKMNNQANDNLIEDEKNSDINQTATNQNNKNTVVQTNKKPILSKQTKKNPKPIVDKNKPKPIGIKQDKVDKVVLIDQQPAQQMNKPIPLEIKRDSVENIQDSKFVKDNQSNFNQFGIKEDNYNKNLNYNQGKYQYQEYQGNSIYNPNAYRGSTLNKFSKPYQRGNKGGEETHELNTNLQSNSYGNQDYNQQITQLPEKGETNLGEKIKENKGIVYSNLKNIKEDENKKIEAVVEKKTEADQLREQYNNLQMGFKLGGDSTPNLQLNAQTSFSNPKTVVSEKFNDEANLSQLDYSEQDEDKTPKLINMDDEESLHNNSEKDKFYEESGTEDKREDIKLNFNSIFGYHSNVKIITNDEKDQIEEEENAEKEENKLGGTYFNEQFFNNFDKVFKKSEPFDLSNEMNLNNNPFVSDFNKVSALNELRDDEDEKFKLDSLNEYKPSKLDELENDDDDEKEPEWDDENLDLKNEGFFDETGTYKLKQINFNFDLDMKRIKR